MSEDEIHPLDRDYSVPYQLPKRKRFAHLSRMHRAGLTAFAGGFLTLVLAAIALGNVPERGILESIGSFLHRTAMYAVLVGGILLLIEHKKSQGKPTFKALDVAAKGEDADGEGQEEAEIKIEEEPESVEFDDSMVDVPAGSGRILSGIALTIGLVLLSASLLSAVMWQMGLGQAAMAMTWFYTSLLMALGYPIAMACCWAVICNPAKEHLYAKIAATIIIVGWGLRHLAGVYFFAAWVPLLMIVALIVSAAGVSVMLGMGVRGPNRVRPASRVSEAGVLVTVTALGWFVLGTIGLMSMPVTMALYSDTATFFLMCALVVAILAYWQPRRDLYFAGLGGLLITSLPFLPLFLSSHTSLATMVAVITIVWIIVLGLVLAKPLNHLRRTGWL